MRAYLSFFLIFFVLGSCTLPGTQTETSSNLVQIQTNNFSLNLPKNWKKSDDIDLPSTKYGTIELSYASLDVKYGFSNNILILSDELKTPMTSTKYAQLNQVQTTQKYLEYTKLKNDPILYPDGDTSQVYTFEARYNTSTPRMKFVQTAKVCGTRVYLLHVTLSLEKDPATYIDLLKSFQCQ
jgi:hypothetical protein